MGFEIKKFIGFAGVSGVCWLIDFTILLTLVHFFEVNPLVANLISSTIAATLAFLIFSKMIFETRTASIRGRLVLYLIYNSAMIVVSSYAINTLHTILVSWVYHGWDVAVAKILITPLVMTMNFFYSKYLIEILVLKRDG